MTELTDVKRWGTLEELNISNDMEYDVPFRLQERELAHDRQGRLHPWFAVRVRSNYERVTAIHLRERDY